MVDIKVLASGSKGNCTAVTHGKTTILLDAGINFGTLQQALNFENPAAVFITHEHSDHVNKVTLNELLKRGVNVYMTNGTASALKLEPRHNLKWNPATLRIEKNIEAFPLYVKHDAANPVNFIVNQTGTGWQEKILYITDTGDIPQNLINRTYDPNFRKIIIEANHSVADLLNSNIDERQKDRILNNHLSVEKVVEYIGSLENRFLEEVHLIHISKRHGNPEQFKNLVQGVVGDKVKVFAY